MGGWQVVVHLELLHLTLGEADIDKPPSQRYTYLGLLWVVVIWDTTYLNEYKWPINFHICCVVYSLYFNVKETN